MNTRRIATRLTTLTAQEWANLSESDWTPGDSACRHPGRRHPVDANLWKSPPWSTLDFSVDDPSYYQYRLRRDDQGWVVEASGDLDCDGVFSTFRRHVTPEGVGELETQNELE